jgi:Zn-dependent protease
MLLAITVHEYAHGVVAYYRGDPTAYFAGRLTLNPFAHLDPIGSLMLLIAHVGWAKPVPVDPRNLRHPREDMLWVSLAGPLSNGAVAIAVAALVRLLAAGESGGALPATSEWLFGPLLSILIYAVYINLILAFFNLLPVPPLDGSKILSSLLPPQAAYQFAQLERLGPLLLLALILLENFSGIGFISSLVVPAAQRVGLLLCGAV